MFKIKILRVPLHGPYTGYPHSSKTIVGQFVFLLNACVSIITTGIMDLVRIPEEAQRSEEMDAGKTSSKKRKFPKNFPKKPRWSTFHQVNKLRHRTVFR